MLPFWHPDGSTMILRPLYWGQAHQQIYNNITLQQHLLLTHFIQKFKWSILKSTWFLWRVVIANCALFLTQFSLPLNQMFCFIKAPTFLLKLRKSKICPGLDKIRLRSIERHSFKIKLRIKYMLWWLEET